MSVWNENIANVIPKIFPLKKKMRDTFQFYTQNDIIKSSPKNSITKHKLYSKQLDQFSVTLVLELDRTQDETLFSDSYTYQLRIEHLSNPVDLYLLFKHYTCVRNIDVLLLSIYDYELTSLFNQFKFLSNKKGFYLCTECFHPTLLKNYDKQIEGVNKRGSSVEPIICEHCINEDNGEA